MTFSIMPSASRPSRASPDRFSSGRTAIEGLAGGGGRCGHDAATPGRRRTISDSAATARQLDAARAASRRRRRSPVEPHPVRPHRPRDVLDPLLAGELQRQAELALELVVGGARDQHAARLAQLLQAGRDVDAVAEQVVALDHDVAEVDADAEDDAAVGRRSRPAARSPPSAPRPRRRRRRPPSRTRRSPRRPSA